MADTLMAKVRADGKCIRTLTVKVRYNDMMEDQCGESLEEPTDLETDIYGRLGILLRKAWRRRISLRLVSLKLSNIYDSFYRSELALDRAAEQRESRRRLARIVDDLKRRCGSDAILRGHDFILRDARNDRGKNDKNEAQSTKTKQKKKKKLRLKTRFESNVDFENVFFSFLICVGVKNQNRVALHLNWCTR